ncbi:MAG: response regulator [Nitrosotalea sp.]
MSEEKLKILYIENRPEEVDGIIKMLERKFTVKLEKDPEAARKELLKNPYDVILLDYDFVDLDTADIILEKIRKENYHIKVIMVTAILRDIHQLARTINQGISKCYFKSDPELLDNLQRGIYEVVRNRDEIIHGLETWIKARKKDKNKPLLIAGNKSYSATELLNEVKRNSEIGKAEIKALVLLAIKLLNEDKS